MTSNLSIVVLVTVQFLDNDSRLYSLPIYVTEKLPVELFVGYPFLVNCEKLKIVQSTDQNSSIATDKVRLATTNVAQVVDEPNEESLASTDSDTDPNFAQS